MYFAIAHEGTPEALREGFKYFLFNVAGAGFLFLGIGPIVAYTGTGEFAGVAKGFASLSPAVGTSIMLLMAVGLHEGRAGFPAHRLADAPGAGPPRPCPATSPPCC